MELITQIHKTRKNYHPTNISHDANLGNHHEIGLPDPALQTLAHHEVAEGLVVGGVRRGGVQSGSCLLFQPGQARHLKTPPTTQVKQVGLIRVQGNGRVDMLLEKTVKLRPSRE